MDKKVADGAVKPAADDGLRHIMTTFHNPPSHSGQCKIGSRDPEKEDVYPIPALLEPANQAEIASARESRLETEVFPASQVELDFLKHQPPRPKGSCFRRKRRHTLRDQIRVDEILAVRVIRKKFSREGRLAGTIWSSNNVKVGTHPFQ